MRFNKYLLSIFIMFSFNANSAYQWTDQNNYQGQGVAVKSIQMQWQSHWVHFTGSDNRSYYYYWGTQEMPDEKAKIIYSTLLAAFTAQKRVSIYYDHDSTGDYPFMMLNLHD